MNAPDRSESWRLGDDEKKLIYQPETKVPHAATFVINKEDHTIGNLLRMRLLQEQKVRFAGYIHPHPLTNCIHLKVQTTGENTPQEALSLAFEDLYTIAGSLADAFQQAVDRKKHQEHEQQFVQGR